LLRKVIFLDRDGTINIDSPNYIKNWEEFEFLPRSLNAIKELTLNGFATLVITNQSAVARKLISLHELEQIHTRMRHMVQSNGGKIKDVFYCPHMPDDGCDCRKPQPGLIHQAQKKYHIDLSAAIIVGDSDRDIVCGRNAGCGRAVMVKTGNSKKAQRLLAEKGIAPDFVAEDLYEAAQWIINTHSEL
jgi:D-glycero-D-manno-heptose 1,7-bisphosphate phosphatase